MWYTGLTSRYRRRHEKYVFAPSSFDGLGGVFSIKLENPGQTLVNDLDLAALVTPHHNSNKNRIDF